jgi:hypothetical protein
MGIRLSTMAFFKISIRRCIADGDDGCAKLGGMPMANWHTGGIGNRIGMIIFRLQRRRIDCVPAQSSTHSHRDSAPTQGKHSLSSLFSDLLLDVQRAE